MLVLYVYRWIRSYYHFGRTTSADTVVGGAAIAVSAVLTKMTNLIVIVFF